MTRGKTSGKKSPENSDRKVQTSFRLSTEEDNRYKEFAKTKGITFNQLVRECLAAAYINQDFLNPVKEPMEWDEILKDWKTSIKDREVHLERIDERLASLERQLEALLSQQGISPAKDKSGEMIFDE